MKINAHAAQDFLALLLNTRMSQNELLKSVIARIQADCRHATLRASEDGPY